MKTTGSLVTTKLAWKQLTEAQLNKEVVYLKQYQHFHDECRSIMQFWKFDFKENTTRGVLIFFDKDSEVGKVVKHPDTNFTRFYNHIPIEPSNQSEFMNAFYRLAEI